MPRRLDDYSFDASGFGSLIRGRETPTTTPMGVVNYRKGLFDKDPTFDEQGNPLAATKAGRRIIADLNLKKLGSGLAVDHFTKIAQLENTLAMAKEAARVDGVTKGELATIAARGDETRKTSNNAGEAAEKLSAADHARVLGLPVNQEALAALEANKAGGVFGKRAEAANALANYGIAQSGARGLPYQTSLANSEIDQSRANVDLTKNNAIAALFQGISPGGSVLLGKTGIESLVTPFSQNTEVIPPTYDKAGNLLSAESQRTINKDPLVRRSVIPQYGPPGSVLPPKEPAPANGLSPATIAPVPVSQPLGVTNPVSQMLRKEMASLQQEQTPSVFSQMNAASLLPSAPSFLRDLMPSANQINSMRSSPEADLLRRFGINISPGLDPRHMPNMMPMTRPFKF